MQLGSSSDGRILKRADPSTIQDKFLVGYQGWFTCPGDGKPLDPDHHGWLHWFNYPVPDGGRPNTDLWPDVSDYTSSELFPAPGLTLPSGATPGLFSSRHPLTVQRHFHWMALHGVDGAFLQRFAGQCDVKEGENSTLRDQRDEVGDRVREAAEKEGRVWAIMYDVSGVDADRIQGVIERDWLHLVNDKKILESPNYLHEKGKPVISLWGFAFETAHHSPSSLIALTAFLRSSTSASAYLIAGTPTHWRTASHDADPNPEFVEIFAEHFDAISPWTVGRYGNAEEAGRFAEEHIKGDMEFLKSRREAGGRRVDYMPVVLPGGSGSNLSEGHWDFNGIPRDGGKFLWAQIHNARRLGVRVMYGAMWDEYDEGTAFMPVVQTKRQVPLPVGEGGKYRFMALDEDGYDLPGDWYMRICGFAAEGLRSERLIHETFPSKELQDYWASRPHYEPDSSQASGSGGGEESAGNAEEKKYQAWVKTQGDEKDELPPPPYSLEAEAEEAAAAGSGSGGVREQSAASLSRNPSAVAQAFNPSTQPQSPSSQTQATPPPINPASRPPPVSASSPPVNPFSRPSPAPVSPNALPPQSQASPISVDTLSDNFARHASLAARPPPAHPARLSPHASISYGSGRPPPPPLTTRPPSSPIPRPGSGPAFPFPESPHHPHTFAPPQTQQGSPYGIPQAHAPTSLYSPPAHHPPQSLYAPPHGPPPPSSPYSPSSRPAEGDAYFPQPQHHAPPSGPPPQQQHYGGYQPPYSTSGSGGWGAPQPSHQQSSYRPPYAVPSSAPAGGASPPLGFPQPGEASPYGTGSALGSGPSSPYGPLVPHHNRPSSGYNAPYQYPGIPGPPPQSQASAPFLDHAFSTIGNIAGDERRRQLEQGVGRITQTGTRIFRKFAG